MNAKSPYLPLPKSSGASRAQDWMTSLLVVMICALTLISATTWLLFGPARYHSADTIRRMNTETAGWIGLTLATAYWFLLRRRDTRRLGARLIDLGPAPLRGIHRLSIALWGLALGCFVLRPPSRFADLGSVFMPGVYFFLWAAPALSLRRAIHEGGVCCSSQSQSWSLPWATLRMALVADESNSLILTLKDGSTREIDISRTNPGEVRRVLAARMPRDPAPARGGAGNDDNESNPEDMA